MYKTYTFEQAFNEVYAQQIRLGEQKAKKYAQQVEQNNVDNAIEEAMKSGLTRNEAIMKLYPNG